MNKQLIAWINENLGYSISDKYYSKIDIWLDWWRGYFKPFHRFSYSNGKKRIERDLYTLKMGKKVCEDWASILLNSKTHIKISDEQTNIFVQGRRETEGILGANSFWTKGNRLIERAFATGTGAVTVHASGIKLVGSGGDLTVDISPDAALNFNYLSADYIIPLTVDNDRITEAAFASSTVEKSKKYLLLEIHTLDGNGCYVIENRRFLAENDQLVEEALPSNMIRRFCTGSPVPWFAIFMPNIDNNVEDNNGLGVSIIHGAIDALKAVDLCFNNFCADFYLGQKKIFMEKSLSDIDENGTEIAPDDVHQQLFTYVQFPTEDQGKEKANSFIMEFNPALRVDDNTKGVQSALDYLSFKCGLGNKHYQFNGGTVVTATQYTGDKQDLIQNADKHYAEVERFLLSLVRSVIHIGKNLMGADVADNAEIEIDFDRSVIIDDTAERLQDLQEVRDGVKAPWEFRVKYYGDTEEDAKKILDELKGVENVDLGFEDGDG